MKGFLGQFTARRRWALIMLALSFASCAPAPEADTLAAMSEQSLLADVPEEARTATRRGEPRPPSYWALWNGCAPQNRAETAVANGGRAAGWFLMDDLLADPGIELGEYPVTTCAEGLAVLEGDATKSEGAGDIDNLAAQLLAAELNLNAGAETCPIAEEAVVGAHLVLSGANFGGPGTAGEALDDDLAGALPRFAELLEGYNGGELCR